jgi:hypothetical protein
MSKPYSVPTITTHEFTAIPYLPVIAWAFHHRGCTYVERAEGGPKYDYLNQVWVRPAGQIMGVPVWRSEQCGHATAAAGCYACAHMGALIVDHDQIH